MNPMTSRRTDADPSFLPPKPLLRVPCTPPWTLVPLFREIASRSPTPVRGMGFADEGESPRQGSPFDASTWENDMRRLFPGGSGPCRYALDGRAGSPVRCTRNYECEGCLVDHTYDYRPTAALIESYRRLGRRNSHENEST